ncbi:hypothetical protein OPT61_g5407 [Boeremia exigua]|uniref:Uncharacterized protein n=1 Tax=Boeremia exigua TaxID=749465 RepID=A0ACC2IAM5_9PLEO|nr:hypothetical protein OPT61_g5407 [Boeremia exigua]
MHKISNPSFPADALSVASARSRLYIAERDWSFFQKKQLLHRDQNAVHGDADSDKPVILIVHTPPPSILATCRTIHDEALPIIIRRRRRPQVNALRFMCGADFLDVLSQQDGLLDIVLNCTTASGGIPSSNNGHESNEDVQAWLLDAALVTPKDTERPQYPILTHIIDQVQQNLCSRHALPIEISLVDRNLHMFEQFVEIFYWRAMEKQGNAMIKVGMAGSQYFENPSSLKRWEDTLSYVLRDLDDAMDMRSLVYGTSSAIKVLRAPRLIGSTKHRWDEEWARGQ